MTAEYRERIKKAYVEDIMDHSTNEHYANYITFEYLSMKEYEKKISIGGIEKVVKHREIETMENLPFKNGDSVRFGNESYSIQTVDKKIPKQYETLVIMSPGSKDRYTVKVITFYV